MAVEASARFENARYYAKQLDHERSAMEHREKGDGSYAPPPHTISIAVNNKCMLKCLHCDVGSARRSKTKKFFYYRGTGGEKKLHEIPMDVFRGLIDQVHEFKPVIRPTFLEPLLRRDLFDLVGCAKSRDLTVNLQTNGFLLPNCFEKVVDSGIDVLRVSLDGPSEVHDEIRGVRGTFDRAIKGLTAVIDYKSKRNLKKPNLGISLTVSSHNYQEIVATFDILNSLGVLDNVYVSINFLRFITRSEAEAFNRINIGAPPITESSFDSIQLAGIDLNRLTDQLELLLQKYPQDKYQYHFFPSALTRKDIRRWFASDEFLYPEIVCHVPWAHCQILYNGDVVVNGRCCSPSLGNIYHEDFLSLWNGEAARQFRRTLKKRGNFPVCNRCCRKFNTRILG